jgi:hypothetical protein
MLRTPGSTIGMLSVWLLVGLVAPALPLAGQEPTDAEYAERIQPTLEQYCFDCHSGDGAEADVQLDTFASVAQLREGRTTWLKVLAQLRAMSMPPSDMDQPDGETREALITWIDRTINSVDCSGPVSPGRVTLRRLNRHEYRNTVRDWLGIDYTPAADFPGDDVGYGFDNIGDVLSLPPLLMEKYLAAAEEISQQAIVVPPPPPLQTSTGGDALEGNGSASGDLWGMSTSGEAGLPITFPQPGLYRIRVWASGDQAGSEPVKLSLRIDGSEAGQHDIRAPRDEPELVTTVARVEAGERRLGVAFLNDYYRPATDSQPGEDRNLFIRRIDVRGPLSAGAQGELPPSHRRIVIATPDEQTALREAAVAVLTPLATAAFRRPATEHEVSRLVQLVEIADGEGESFEAGIQWALQALLVSPHFLFRVELDPEGDAETRALNDYELAVRLSYFLWSSMPDQELFALAGEGRLRQGDHLERQVRRMLADPKSQAYIENFAGQWLQLRSLEDLAFDPQRFPGCDRILLAAMREETVRFFTSIVREDQSLLRLLDADFTFVNERLANHYGLPGVEGSDFRRVSLQGTPRAGILTQASVLAVTSNPTRTSPVKRGKFVLENLLGSPPPPPPADVPLLDDAERQLTGTLRQRMEQHRTNPTCAACHKLMDPIGFAMENFDAVGRYRTTDGDDPIDPSGELPSGEPFAGLDELRDVLVHRKRDEFAKCLVEKTLVYALGRGLEYYDQCAVNELRAALEQDDYRFSRLVLEVVNSDPFQKRARKRSQP